MVDQLIRDLKIHKNNILSSLLIFPISFLFGILFVVLIIFTDNTVSKWFCMGTVITLIVTVIYTLVHGFFYYQEYMMALSMGRIRRDFMISYTVRRILWLVIAYIFILAFYQLEQILYSVCFPQHTMSISFLFLYNLPLVLTIIICLTILTMFIGTLYSRFGKKFAVIFYFIWIGSCFLFQKLLHMDNSNPIYKAIFGWIFTVPPIAWVIFGIIAVIAIVIIIYRLGMKQMVR